VPRIRTRPRNRSPKSGRELFADTVGPVDEPVPPRDDMSGRPRGQAGKMSIPVVVICLLGAGLIAGAILGAAALLKPPAMPLGALEDWLVALVVALVLCLWSAACHLSGTESQSVPQGDVSPKRAMVVSRKRAMVCCEEDCEVIFSISPTCPKCGSTRMIPLTGLAGPMEPRALLALPAPDCGGAVQDADGRAGQMPTSIGEAALDAHGR
jgi:hypothetical protein